MSSSSSYDSLPYACRAIRWTHPDNLACKASLYGLTVRDIERCRVLEIGCGNGMNLFSLAQGLPHASFVGIDNSPAQVDQGRQIARAIACQNVELLTLSVDEVVDSLGQFDYILCHGVYSWVPPATAQQILLTIRRCLSPQGVAYVSYNTYPGWHERGMIREMLLQNTDAAAGAVQRVRQARAYLDFLLAHVPQSRAAYRQLLAREREILSRAPDAYLYHEHLEQWNQPLYFQQFAGRVADSGLQYLCEAEFQREAAQFSDALLRHLEESSQDRIAYEQQIDCLLNETFRKSLLCHSEVAVSTQPSLANLPSLAMRMAGKWEMPTDDLGSDRPAVFRSEGGGAITTASPLLKAALAALTSAWPAAISLCELLDRCGLPDAGGDQAISPAEPRAGLAAALLRCHASGFVELHWRKPPIVRVIGNCPEVSSLLRWQAAHAEPMSNLVHELVELDAVDRALVVMLDGRTELSDIERRLVQKLVAGELDLPTANQTPATMVQHLLAQRLKKLALMCCLQR